MEENEKCKHRIINKTNCATCHEKFCCECYAIYIKKNEKSVKQNAQKRETVYR